MTTLEELVRRALPASGWKGNEYRGPAPYRPGSDGEALHVTILGPDSGKFKDFKDEHGGGLVKLLKLLGVEVPSDRPWQANNTKVKYDGLEDYARSHGVPADAFRAAGWVEETYQNRPALRFETENGTRWRFIDGNQPKYKSVEGYSPCWYGMKRGLPMARDKGLPLVITNGEPSVIAAQHHGIPAVAQNNGEGSIKPDNLDIFKERYPAGEVYLAFDCDDTGAKAERIVAHQLTEAGYKVYTVDLKMTDKGDLADFCTIYHVDAMEELKKRARPFSISPQAQEQRMSEELAKSAIGIERALSAIHTEEGARDLQRQLARHEMLLNRISSKVALPQILKGEDVPDYQPVYIPSGFKDLDTIIGGFPIADVSVILAATGMGKTTISASIVANIIDDGPGLLVTTESQPGIYKSKILSALARRQYRSPLPSDQEIIMRHRGAFNRTGWDFYDDPAPNVRGIRAAMLDGGYRVLVIDSVSRLVNAGDFAQVNGAMNAIQELARELQIAIICTSQVGRDLSTRPKGEKRPRLNDGYGGGPIENNAGLVLGLYRHDYYVKTKTEDEDPNLPAGTAALTVLKVRNEAGVGTEQKLAYIGGVGFYNLDKRHGSLADPEREGTERKTNIDVLVSTGRK